MSTSRLFLLIAATCLPMQAASAQTPQPASPPSETPKATASVCVAGSLIEAWSEGAWYPVTVLDPLRDGRCFVHYDDYGSDDDEALAPKHIRPRR